MHEPPLPRIMTNSGLARFGITEARARTELRRGRWQRLAPGLLLTRPDPPTRYDWVNAAMEFGGPASVLSGWDASRLHGLGTARPPGPDVLVIAAPGRRNRRVGAIRVRPSARPIGYLETSPLDGELPGVRYALPARAVCDTALQLSSLAPVRALVTGAVQRGLCTPQQVAAEFANGPRNGSGPLHRALADVIAGARSVAEAEAVALLRATAVSPFEVNALVCDRQGRVVAIADLLWRELRVVVEIDSREFHFGEQDWKATMRRHNRLTALGYAVAHYPPSEIRTRRGAWAREIAGLLAERSAALGVRSA